MLHQQAGMAHRWERHYPETRSTLAVGLMLFGAVIVAVLGMVWPQKLSAEIFDSRLAYHLIMDIEDFWTCDKDYIKFIIDEPVAEEQMLTFFMFNVSNAADIVERGYKPMVTEVGPYGFVKKTYKYDVYFDPVDSLYVTYKEYTLLEEVTDQVQCTRVSAIMDRQYLQSFDSCENGGCLCRSTNETLTMLNPLFLKTQHDDSTHAFLSQYALEVYLKIKGYLENDFPIAVRAHLVSNSLSEVYQFRVQMQFAKLLQQMVDYFVKPVAQGGMGKNYFYVSRIFTANMSTGAFPIPTSCNLDLWTQGLKLAPKDQLTSSDCPINAYPVYYQYFNGMVAKWNLDNEESITGADIPSLAPLFNASWKYSLVHTDSTGLSNWLGLGFLRGQILYNSPNGYTMLSSGDLDGKGGWEDKVIKSLLLENIRMKIMGPGYEEWEPAKAAAKYLISSVILWMGNFFNPTTLFGAKYMTVMTNLAYLEFYNEANLVDCAPLGQKCLWSWGYMRKKYGGDISAYPMSLNMLSLLVDANTKVDTNPLHVYFYKNSAVYYNSHMYCTKVMDKNIDFNCPSTDYGFCTRDGEVSAPAPYWGFDQPLLNKYGQPNDDRDIANRTKNRNRFSAQSSQIKYRYVRRLCNMSSLLYDVYPSRSSFHDNYVVRYLNNRRDNNFDHIYSTSNWKELGWAQFGGGFVTFSILQVRSIFQVTRDAMWYFAPFDYYNQLIEFSSWSKRTGYPVTYLYNITDAKNLLYALSDDTNLGVEFRQRVAFAGTTLIGDGVNYFNGIGDVGEVAFTPEANLGDFSCPGRAYESSCDVLNEHFSSSAAMCESIEDEYKLCQQLVISGNIWVVNCRRFETTLTSPDGIQCDDKVVYGKPHPYVKRRGNVLFEMLFALMTNLRLRSGLWCRQPLNCDYSWGGLVTSTKVRQMLFEGYSDPTLLAYLNLKHHNDKVSFSCVNSVYPPYEGNCVGAVVAGQLICDPTGLVMDLPAGQTKLLAYGKTPNDEYFAPYFEMVASTGELIWAFSSSPDKVKHAAKVRASGQAIVRIVNPHWAAYPALNSGDVEFIKFYECQNRYYGGMPNKFNSCVNRLDTGRRNISLTKDVQAFQGNESIYWFGGNPVPVNGTFEHGQGPMSLWKGFLAYPYTFNGTKGGPLHTSMKVPRVFHKIHPINLAMDASQYIYDWEYNIDLAVPIDDSFKGNTRPNPQQKIIRTRRFSESKATWIGLKELGKPLDSFGMPYEIPIAMASLERLVGFPFFAGTPHGYGNKMWGGGEYDHVQGTDPKQLTQKTYVDYEPITGKNLRQVVRQSVNLRIEQGALYPNVFSSQQRCVTPTKSYSQGTGYGCFCYAPLLWYEEGRVVNTDEFYRTFDHFYRRPFRAQLLQEIGTVVGAVCIIVGATAFAYEFYHRRRFVRRVYID